MTASNEVEEMSRHHFWTLAAAFSLAALVHVFYDRFVPENEWEALGSVLAIAAIAYVSGRLREWRGGEFAVGFIVGMLLGPAALPLVWFVPARAPRPGRGMKAATAATPPSDGKLGCAPVAVSRWSHGRSPSGGGRRMVSHRRQPTAPDLRRARKRWVEDPRQPDFHPNANIPPAPLTLIPDITETRSHKG